MGTKIQEYMASFDLSRAFRQFQKAEKAFNNDQTDSAVNHLEKGLNLVAKSIDHISNAVDDAFDNAAGKFEKGNEELQKSIDAFADGNDDSAERHYEKALDLYDEALALVE
jgi:tetratricopeptide (TPR) repeat protein